MACPGTKGETFGMSVQQKALLATPVLHSEKEEHATFISACILSSCAESSKLRQNSALEEWPISFASLRTERSDNAS